MRIVLMLNPTAGGAAAARLSLNALAADLAGHVLEVLQPKDAAGATAMAHQAVADGVDRLLVGGGDGTIHCVLPVLMNSRTALGILPVGTVNVLARELRLPLDPSEALHVALHGQPKRIDLGLANGRPFSLMAGLGFDARVVTDVVPRLKELFGPLAYVTAGLQALTSHRSSLLQISMDDLSVSIPAWLMIVGNATYYTYELSLSPDARNDDGLLDVCIFAEQTVLDRMTQLFATAVGLHPLHPNITLFRTRNLRVAAEPSMQVQLDGDPAGATPVEITVQPAALTVMTPCP